MKRLLMSVGLVLISLIFLTGCLDQFASEEQLLQNQAAKIATLKKRTEQPFELAKLPISEEHLIRDIQKIKDKLLPLTTSEKTEISERADELFNEGQQIQNKYIEQLIQMKSKE